MILLQISEDSTEVPCAIKKEDIIVYPTNELLSMEKQVRV